MMIRKEVAQIIMDIWCQDLELEGLNKALKDRQLAMQVMANILHSVDKESD